jgi:hypothetical protein
MNDELWKVLGRKLSKYQILQMAQILQKNIKCQNKYK